MLHCLNYAFPLLRIGSFPFLFLLSFCVLQNLASVDGGHVPFAQCIVVIKLRRTSALSALVVHPSSPPFMSFSTLATLFLSGCLAAPDNGMGLSTAYHASLALSKKAIFCLSDVCTAAPTLFHILTHGLWKITDNLYHFINHALFLLKGETVLGLGLFPNSPQEQFLCGMPVSIARSSDGSSSGIGSSHNLNAIPLSRSLCSGGLYMHWIHMSISSFVDASGFPLACHCAFASSEGTLYCGYNVVLVASGSLPSRWHTQV